MSWPANRISANQCPLVVNLYLQAPADLHSGGTMKTKPHDAVMAEMHAIKDANSARFGHNIDRLFDHLQTVDLAGITKTRRVIPKRPPGGPTRQRQGVSR